MIRVARVKTLGLAGVAVLAVSAGVVGLIASAAAAGRPSGSYRSQVNNSTFRRALNGSWKLDLSGGAYTLTFTGKRLKGVIVTGRYAITDRQITFQETTAACSSKRASDGCAALMSCRGAGIYTFRTTGGVLGFVRVRDRHCEYRTIVFSESFRKVP
jgi:hypothetical protein